MTKSSVLIIGEIENNRVDVDDGILWTWPECDVGFGFGLRSREDWFYIPLDVGSLNIDNGKSPIWEHKPKYLSPDIIAWFLENNSKKNCRMKLRKTSSLPFGKHNHYHKQMCEKEAFFCDSPIRVACEPVYPLGSHTAH